MTSSSSREPSTTTDGGREDAPTEEWCVFDTSNSYYSGSLAAGRLVKITPKQFKYTGRWSSDTRPTTNNGHPLKRGLSEAEAKALVERDQSSHALMNEERRNALLRHKARRERLLAAREGPGE